MVSRPQNQVLASLRFPVLCFSQGLANVADTEDELTTATKAGLKGGYFDNLLVVGSNGYAMRFRGARKLHGIGRFRGYDIFLSQTIRVELIPAGSPFEMSLEDIKKKVRGSFRGWHGWSSRGDFDQLQAKIERAGSVSEVIRVLGSTP